VYNKIAYLQGRFGAGHSGDGAAEGEQGRGGASVHAVCQRSDAAAGLLPEADPSHRKEAKQFGLLEHPTHKRV
jgi:hypothetical protein